MLKGVALRDARDLDAADPLVSKTEGGVAEAAELVEGAAAPPAPAQVCVCVCVVRPLCLSSQNVCA